MNCPKCEHAITRTDRRYEDEPRTRDYPGSYTDGCKFCLKGRHVFLYLDHADALREEAAERRLSEQREGAGR